GKLFERAYRLQQQYAPSEVSKRAYIESYYGDFRFSQHRYTEAIDFYDKAIANYRRVGSVNSYYSLYAKADKGVALGYLNQRDEAIRVQREALAGFRQHFPQSNNSARSFLDRIAVTYRDAKQFDQALAYSDSVFLADLQMDQLPADPSVWIPRLSYSFNSCVF